MEETVVSGGGMRRLWRRAAGLAVVLAAVIQFVRPSRTNPIGDPSRALPARASVPADAGAVLNRACRDCHSNDTRWPWYSNVAPVSWFVIDHVNHGRSHFNYSDWAKYEPAEARRLIEKVCTLSREGEMPLSSYLLLHRDARLSETDVRALCDWAGIF